MKHNHHTTPRYYLKGFRIPEQPAYIWQYHRGTPYQPGHRSDRHNPVKRALKKAGTITDYYGTYEDDSNTAKPAQHQSSNDFAQHHTTPPLRPHPSGQSATHRLHRPPHEAHNRTRRAHPKHLEDRPRPTAHDPRSDATRPRIRRPLHRRPQDRRDQARIRRRHPDEIRRRSILMPFDRVRSRIIELRWTFLTTPTPALLTSDNPVRYPEHEGLGHHLAFLTIPWSTTITLFASTQQAAALFTLPSAEHDCAARTVTPEQVATLNHLTITGAHQYLYSHRADEDIARSFG